MMDVSTVKYSLQYIVSRDCINQQVRGALVIPNARNFQIRGIYSNEFLHAFSGSADHLSGKKCDIRLNGV